MLFILEIVCLDRDIINKYGHEETAFKKIVLTLKHFLFCIRNRLTEINEHYMKCLYLCRSESLSFDLLCFGSEFSTA